MRYCAGNLTECCKMLSNVKALLVMWKPLEAKSPFILCMVSVGMLDELVIV